MSGCALHWRVGFKERDKKWKIRVFARFGGKWVFDNLFRLSNCILLLFNIGV